MNNLSGRNGIALYLIVSALLSVFILVSTFFLGSNKIKSRFIPAISRVKADYYLESAALMALNKAISNAADNQSLKIDFPTREVSPGLSIIIKEISSTVSSKRILVLIEGEGISRHLEALMVQSDSNEGIPLSNGWYVKFFPDFSE
ncbi:MAG: hypothetical protein HQM10_01180 [Candidatus Riflebacteria bacterium]|nr:hypothetical protein [Candidatus Riflebacteria bacterium]